MNANRLRSSNARRVRGEHLVSILLFPAAIWLAGATNPEILPMLLLLLLFTGCQTCYGGSCNDGDELATITTPHTN
jgi:4-hydroxybenzoate polyprenyltransferase